MELREVFNVEVKRDPADAAVLKDPTSSVAVTNEIMSKELDRANIVDKEIEVAAYQAGISVKFCNYANQNDAPTCGERSEILVEAPASFKAILEKLPYVGDVRVETKPTTKDLPFAF